MSEEIKTAAAREKAALRDEQRQQTEEAKKLLREMEDSPEASSEAEKRRAHEEAEAERKAKWEVEQKAKVDAIQYEWERAVDLPSAELAAASVKRIGDMTEYLTRRNMKQCITEHLQTRCYEDTALACQIMHPKKSMLHCFQYISRKALAYLKQEQAEAWEKQVGGAIGGDVPDDLCYQWAEEYFNDMDAQEDRDEKSEKFVPMPYPGSSSGGRKKPAQKPPKPEKKPEPKQDETSEQQISLF